MIEYQKIETLFNRDTEGTKKLIYGDFRNETVEFLQRIPWTWTEKIDGTNVRVHWDGHSVEYAGRTDKATLPDALVKKLDEYFGGEENAQIFEQKFGDKEVILFGEGYGAKINKGEDYTEDGSVDFRVFDVMIQGNYQDRENVMGIATAFGVNTVPIVGFGPLDEAIEFIKCHPYSRIGNRHDMEGIVCRPSVELCDRCGNRLIVKIKWKDFKDIDNVS